jgi:POLQ-like helicase
MKPSATEEIAARITRAKGRMFEYQVPVAAHLKVPEGLVIEDLFPLAIGTLGDFADEVITSELGAPAPTTDESDVRFSADVLQAYVDARFDQAPSRDLLLYSACAYYLAKMPGNASVLIGQFRRLSTGPSSDAVEEALELLLGMPWAASGSPESRATRLGNAWDVLHRLRQYYEGEASFDDVAVSIQNLRRVAYRAGSSKQLLAADLISAISFLRMRQSARALLPQYSDLELSLWEPYLGKASALRELWPSQQVLGDAGLYSGRSAVVQMPTSAGKTRAMELVIRASVISGRSRLVIVIAPYRALCQEINDSLASAFVGEDVRLNQISDAIQPDYFQEFLEIFQALSPAAAEEFSAVPRLKHIVVLTPEKLLYVIRQSPELISSAGLVIYDEGHQFDSGKRGVTFELLVTSVRRLLSPTAQIVLISAVVQNAPTVAQWMLGDSGKVVQDQRIQTKRSIAFASWPHALGQLWYLDPISQAQPFFVPRIMSSRSLNLRPRETVERVFPDSENAGSVALYLGLRLIPNGGVAIFCGAKASVAKILRDSVDHYSRGLESPPPRAFSDEGEISSLVALYRAHFGDAYLTKAASLGFFGHHGDMPHGLRLCIEHAIRSQLLPMVICTSTLAQGVNLPIRYLLVTTTWQGRDRIKARDFHNLMGRAGRAGIHGEGTVIFTDPTLFDTRQGADGWRWRRTQELLSPTSNEPTSSSLLNLIKPLTNREGTLRLAEEVGVTIQRLMSARTSYFEELSAIPGGLQAQGFEAPNLMAQLKAKCAAIDGVQSFLMSYRPDGDVIQYSEMAIELCKETYAYSLATEVGKEELVKAFTAIASFIEANVPDVQVQRRYSKTLLSLNDALRVAAWVETQATELWACSSIDQMFDVIWPVLRDFTDDSTLRDLQPLEGGLLIARLWIEGRSFTEILASASAVTYPWGTGRRRLNLDDVMEICEHRLGFDVTLLFSAIREALPSAFPEDEESVSRLIGWIDLLQKRLRYGLASGGAVWFYELGFCDRVVAQQLATSAISTPETISEASALMNNSPASFEPVLNSLPTYFRSVGARILAE